jgi:hypothetical protein
MSRAIRQSVVLRRSNQALRVIRPPLPPSLPQVFLPDSDIDMVVLPPTDLPLHQIRKNLFTLAEVGRERARGGGGREADPPRPLHLAGIGGRE